MNVLFIVFLLNPLTFKRVLGIINAVVLKRLHYGGIAQLVRALA